MKRSFKKFLVLMLLFVCSGCSNDTGGNTGEKIDQDLILGKRILLHSDLLDSDRYIRVYLPANYDGCEERYPVLYILDGESSFSITASIVQFLSAANRIPGMIVIGIETPDRTSYMTPTSNPGYENSGKADLYLSHLENELIPYVEQRYRTEPFRIIAGHSLAGLFSIYTLFEKAGLFDAYIAISPSLMWEENMMVKRASMTMPEFSKTKRLFVTLGNEGSFGETPVHLFDKEIKSKKLIKLIEHFQMFPEDDHGTIPLKSLVYGIEWIYAEWRIPEYPFIRKVSVVKNHFAKLSKEYFYTITPPESTVHFLGQMNLRNNRVEAAIEFFTYQAEIYPESADAHVNIAVAYQAKGVKKVAIDHCKKALELNPDNKRAAELLLILHDRQP